MQPLTPQSQSLIHAVEQLPEEQRKSVVAELDALTFPTDDKFRTQIWITLLVGLFVLGLGALVGGVVLEVKDKDATAVVAIASAVVAGVIGLFANPPTK
jgi:hypothetical protein